MSKTDRTRTPVGVSNDQAEPQCSSCGSPATYSGPRDALLCEPCARDRSTFERGEAIGGLRAVAGAVRELHHVDVREVVAVVFEAWSWREMAENVIDDALPSWANCGFEDDARYRPLSSAVEASS